MRYNIVMLFSNIIKRILKNKHISKEEFAKILDINQTTVNQWLLGKKKPSYDSILLIYNKFCITPNELFDLDR